MQRLVAVLVLILLPSIGIAQQRVEVWNYHSSPPFILEDGQGLSHALVDLLNRDPANHGRFRFELVELPRKRVDIRLARNRPGILLWATPRFFTGAQTANAKWSEPLLMDKQVFVSLPATPFEYEGPNSLHGLVLGGVLGHRYEGLEEEFAKGKIERQNVHSDVQNIEKLLSGRINTLLIAHSTLLYYCQEHKLDDLYISQTPLYQFTRQVLISNALNSAVTDFLEEFLSALPNNPEWEVLLFHYGLKPIAGTQ